MTDIRSLQMQLAHATGQTVATASNGVYRIGDKVVTEKLFYQTLNSGKAS